MFAVLLNGLWKRWGSACFNGQKKDAYRDLVGKCEGSRLLGRPGHGWKLKH